MRSAHPHPQLRTFLGTFGLISFCAGAYWIFLASENFSSVPQAATVELPPAALNFTPAAAELPPAAIEITQAVDQTSRCPAALQRKSRDLLMTAITVGPLAYDVRYRKGDIGDIVERFAGSFRKACGSADIVFVSPGNASVDVYEILQRLRVSWIQVPEEAFVVNGHRLPPGNVVRHSWFTHILTQVAPGQYDRVLIVDADDVYFQADPFAAVGEPFPDLLLTHEPVVAKNLEFFQQNSINSGYTLEEIEQCNELLICGGLFLGKTDTMVEFLSRLLKEATLHVQARFDQHFIYHLKRKKYLDDLPIVYKSGQSLIWHLSQKEDKYFDINAEGLVTDGKNGPVVPILHHIKIGKGKNLFFYLRRYRPPISPPDRMIAGRRSFGSEGNIRL